MKYELDNMMNFEQLDLYYEVHMAGIDGECFNYSVYFKEHFTDQKLEEINAALNEFFKPYKDQDIYLGYVDVLKFDDKIDIYLDLGNVNAADERTAINGILKALHNVSEIKTVIINEDCSFEF